MELKILFGTATIIIIIIHRTEYNQLNIGKLFCITQIKINIQLDPARHQRIVISLKYLLYILPNDNISNQ